MSTTPFPCDGYQRKMTASQGLRLLHVPGMQSLAGDSLCFADQCRSSWGTVQPPVVYLNRTRALPCVASQGTYVGQSRWNAPAPRQCVPDSILWQPL